MLRMHQTFGNEGTYHRAALQRVRRDSWCPRPWRTGRSGVAGERQQLEEMNEMPKLEHVLQALIDAKIHITITERWDNGMDFAFVSRGAPSPTIPAIWRMANGGLAERAQTRPGGGSNRCQGAAPFSGYRLCNASGGAGARPTSRH